MSKKNKSKKKDVGKENRANLHKNTVMLSQCMIVKNEEKNIERALSWAKGFAFEQIVVDTGSTDRTVELAKEFGAKVLHFDWVDDFSVAKNFAMDQARGEWIAILDADEYISREDTEELIRILEQIQNDPEKEENCDAITCSFIDLDENGNTVSLGSHQRIFRNRPYLRYTGRIHEVIKIKNTHLITDDIRIFHTGYTQSAYTDSDKLERNISMLRKEYEKDPDNPDTMHYLANSLLSSGTDEAREEAEELHLRALASNRPANIFVKQLAYDFLIPRFSADNKKDEAIKLCDQAILDIPSNIDYRYYRAVLNNQKGNYKEALEDLKQCEKAFKSTHGLPTSRLMIPCPLPLFYQLTVAAEGLGDVQERDMNSDIIRAILTEGKNHTEMVGPYIRAMSWYGLQDDEVLGRLADVYDLNNPHDMMIIARAAKDSGAIDFARTIMEMLSKLL